jgi:hypothetical protein
MLGIAEFARIAGARAELAPGTPPTP